MQWKREGNELEWIVRQMSWKPPWTNRGQEEIKTDVRNRSATIHKRQPGHVRALISAVGTTDSSDDFRQHQEAVASGSEAEDVDDDVQKQNVSPVFSDTESLVESARSQPISDSDPDQDDVDADADALHTDV